MIPSFDTFFIPLAQLNKTKENWKKSIENQINLKKQIALKISLIKMAPLHISDELSKLIQTNFENHWKPMQNI